ncbi:transporter suffix domain-containing protein [Pseudomonas sp. MAFF212428]|uniref:Transporter suffix domain-containing protein n=1 Tax=Pseudomonas brassicae TaxID=2708063 RepID=A0A6B3P319_9PSED|nr:transporter suffix domain-containing protein [Pseudomonas brassicae]NER59437.1 transporter suffix domain-containing protein [Pseudomonas brassicae]NER66144.1 transporter suffix domain-containing protein [Pseudomonas brassicae]
MNHDDVANAHPTSWRLKVGIAIICLMAASWLSLPVLASAGVPGSRIAALTGILFISNKILLLVVIAVMGKSGFQQLKGKLFGYVSAMAPRSDSEVGPARHALGVVMFCLPILSSFLEPYVDSIWPGARPGLWQLQVLGDLLFVGSFFVLGGNFWDKVRALFIRTARVVNADLDR